MVTAKEDALEDVETESHMEEVETEQAAKPKKDLARKEIDELRSEVNKVSGELNMAIGDLKKSIVDIRSAVSEIENPFNLLRVITNEKDLKKLNGERLPAGVKSLTLGKPENKKTAKEAISEEEIEKTKETENQLAKNTDTAEPSTIEQLGYAQALPAKSGYDYLDWIWSLLELGLSAEDIIQLVKSYEFLGYLPADASRHVYPLAIASEKIRSKGLTQKQMLLNMYNAAVISGITLSSDDVKTLISIAEGRVKNERNIKR